MKKYLTLLLVLAALAAGCAPAAPAGEPESPAGGLQAWVDAPLPGSLYPPGPVEVIAHGSYPSGVKAMELHVEGIGVVDTRTSPLGLSNLMTARFSWNAEAPGTYTLLVRAQNLNDEWSEFAQTTVVIAEGAAGGQPGATAVPGRAVVEGIVFDRVSVAPDQIFFTGSTCGPMQATISVRITGPGVAGAKVYYRTANSPLQGEAVMDSQGGGVFSYVIYSGAIPGEDPNPDLGPLDVKLMFQALNAGGQSLAFSQEYDGLTDTFCSP